jgi:hypothetical protein
LKLKKALREFGLLLLLAAAAIAVHGYHFGVQDGATYIASLKHALDPSLYPLDAAFFLPLTRYSIFIPVVSFTARHLRLSPEVVSLLWHACGIFLLLAACRKLSRIAFREARAQWAAVAATCFAMLMPVAGTGIAVTERYLHPRNLALAFIVLGIAAVLEHRIIAIGWLSIGIALHPTIGLLGAFHAAFQWWRAPRNGSPIAPATISAGATPSTTAMALLFPLAWPSFLPQPNPAWHALIESRRYLFPLRWHWYEWLGIVAPLVLLQVFASISRHDGDEYAAHIARRAALAGTVGVAAAIVVTAIPAFLPLVATEPMRVLQFVYFSLVFIGGGLLGKHLLGDRQVRWAIFIAILGGAFFFADKLEYRSSPHIEWPNSASTNPWITSFRWAEANTPRNALFALDPLYTQLRAEDVHGFRAIAERSMLADAIKDAGVAQVDSDLAFAWQQQTRARQTWGHFAPQDFAKLRAEFHVDWVVIDAANAAASDLDCPYMNPQIAICQLK